MSFVLRLLPEALARSRIVGRVEVVDTGEQFMVRDADELIGFLFTRGIAAASVPKNEKPSGPLSLPSTDPLAPGTIPPAPQETDLERG
jgi:hypothetical protein